MARAWEIPGLAPDDAYEEAARTVVSVRARELFEHAAGVLDVSDIERVHDMRVASRRLRAALEIFAPCFPRELYRGVLRDVKALADALGGRRDPDVHIAALRRLERAVAAPDRPGVEHLIARLREQQEAANAALADALAASESADLRGRIDLLVEAQAA